MHAWETRDLLQSDSKPQSPQPADLPQTKQASQSAGSCLLAETVFEASHFSCLIDFSARDHSAYSPCSIALPH
jgi:hypothetical protein